MFVELPIQYYLLQIASYIFHIYITGYLLIMQIYNIMKIVLQQCYAMPKEATQAIHGSTIRWNHPFKDSDSLFDFPGLKHAICVIPTDRTWYIY